MKLLFITQKVSKSDDVLGFVHSWLIVLAKKFESVIVICLEKGECELPENVTVLSLGKEKNQSRIQYVTIFFQYLWQHRQSYDSVFVHMNPVYVLLGGLFWRLSGKKIALWYNHARGNRVARLAAYLTNRIFYTSPFSFFAQYKKAKSMPAGIDTEFFKKNELSSVISNSFLCLGRISPVKKIEQVVAAAKELSAERTDFCLAIVGSPVNPEDAAYEAGICQTSQSLVEAGQINFYPKIKNTEAPIWYNHYEIFINATPSGSFDKTILEAMATEKLVIVSNQSFKEIVPSICLFTEDNGQDLAKKMSDILALTANEKKELGQRFRAYVCEFHNLELLVKKIYLDFKD